MIGLVTPCNKGLMITFTFLEQTFFGWAQYESVAFTQLGTFTAFEPPIVLLVIRLNMTQESNKSTSA
jgi:hypothetical protein